MEEIKIAEDDPEFQGDQTLSGAEKIADKANILADKAIKIAEKARNAAQQAEDISVYSNTFQWGDQIYTGQVKKERRGSIFKKTIVKPNGLGVSRGDFGNQYAGQWEDGTCTGLGVFKSTTYREGLEFIWECEWKNDQTEGLGIDYCKQNGFKAEGERSTEKGLLFGRRYTKGLLLTGHFNYSNGEFYGIKTKIAPGSAIVKHYETKPFIFTVKAPDDFEI